MRLVVFDLDGTIARHDTLVPFVLCHLLESPWRLLRLVCMVPALLRFLIDQDFGALKATLIRSALGGCSREQIARLAERFVSRLVPDGLFPAALSTIEAHRRAGDHLVLLSASPDLYVPLIARRLGFAECLCTGIAWDGDRLGGGLSTPNCRGEEKARRFRVLRERHAGLEARAYANAASDFAHLELADSAVLVNPYTWLRAEGGRRGMECVEWR